MTLIKNLISLLTIETILLILSDIVGIKNPKFKIGDSVCVKVENKKIRGTVKLSLDYFPYAVPELSNKSQYRYEIKYFKGNIYSFEKDMSFSQCLLIEKRIS